MKGNYKNMCRKIASKYFYIKPVKNVVMFLSLFVLVNGMLVAYTTDYLIPDFSSRESRLLILELLADGRLVGENVEQIISQSSNGKNFKIYSVYDKDDTSVYLIPEIDDIYSVYSIGTWEFSFDASGALTLVQYYFQSSESYRIMVTPFQSSIEVSLVIDDVPIYQGLLIPMGIRNFIRMPLDKFISETYFVLHWEWVFPSVEFAEVNIRTLNMVNYLNAYLSNEEYTRDDNLFDPYIAMSNIERDGLLSIRREQETKYLKSVIDLLLEYIGTEPSGESVFVPYSQGGGLISKADEHYISVYLDNVKNYLSFYPDFHSSIEAIDNPLYSDTENRLNSIRPNLYFMTTKYPGLWYIVPIQRTQRVGDRNLTTTISVEVLIPYFNLDGTFDIHGDKFLEQYLREESEIDYVKYFYGTPIIHRIPHEYKIRLLEKF